MKKNTGFTLIELMITLAIVAILLTVGVPSLKTFMQGNQLIASTNELVSALHVARSEAIKRGTRVSICASTNGKRCSGSSWESGWIVFVDGNGATPGDLQGTGNRCTAKGTDCLLRVHSAFTDNQLTVRGTYDTTATAITSFSFTSRGLPKSANNATQSGVFNICSLDGPSSPTAATIGSRAVVLGLSGRVRISDNTAVIACP